MRDRIVWDEVSGEIDADHKRLDQPAETVLLHREFPTYREVMWLRGYPGAKTIVVTIPEIRLAPDTTMPGVIRDIPVGWRDLASPEAFRARFESVVGSYVAEGWAFKSIAVGTDGEGQ